MRFFVVPSTALFARTHARTLGARPVLDGLRLLYHTQFRPTLAAFTTVSASAPPPPRVNLLGLAPGRGTAAAIQTDSGSAAADSTPRQGTDRAAAPPGTSRKAFVP